MATKINLPLIVVAPLVASQLNLCAFAGTGGIFSSGNPRRKIPVPTPDMPTSLPNSGNRPNRKLLLPALPSGAAPVPLDTQQTKHGHSTLPLHGLGDSRDTRGTTAGAADEGGTVESFFQVNGADAPSRVFNAHAEKSVAAYDAELNQAASQTKKSAVGAPYRVLWHTLDNLGVPMFFGKHDDDLDPVLRRGYQAPALIDDGHTTASTPADQSSATMTGAQEMNGLHGIPDSELEGTGVDEKKK